jgi:hypothetical protein
MELSMETQSASDASSPALAKPDDLTPRQDKFARLYVETGVAADAYETAYCCGGSSRSTVRVNAFRLLRNPKVVQRVRELQDAAADRSLRSTAGLIRDLEQMVEADVNELMRLDVAACRRCWSKRGHRADREPNPECASCHGAGIPRVKFASTADVSAGARRLLRGLELFPDGSVKRVLLHDQMAARIELHRLRGMVTDRSISLHLNAAIPPLPDLTPAQIVELIDQQALIP